MIEQIMYSAIGFLVAGLLLVGFIPMVHARAVRLTRRRLEATTPKWVAEMNADKDQLRAEFAMSTRRLEMIVERVKAKTTFQLAEIGKQSEAIRRLRLELGSNSATVLMLEAKKNALADELESTKQSLQVERTLAESSAALVKVTSDFDKTSMTADCLRIELVALRAQGEVLKGRIESHEREAEALQARLETEAASSAAASRELSEERRKSNALSACVAERDSQIAMQSIEAEILARRVQELVTRLEAESQEQWRALVEGEFSADILVFKEGGWSAQTSPQLRVVPQESATAPSSHDASSFLVDKREPAELGRASA